MNKSSFLIDKKYRKARIWSNRELAKFKDRLSGEIVNVSAWRDEDKEGSTYKEKYFNKASNYYYSNYKKEIKGLQGDLSNEFFLDLEDELDKKYKDRFDVVFNHTTLEHIYDVRTAFKNICEMSADLIIVVVPFLQEQHGAYGDYWRFTPQALKRMCEENGASLIYMNYNDDRNSSIYLFAIASKQKDKWESIVLDKNNKVNLIDDELIGQGIIKNNYIYELFIFLKTCVKRVLRVSGVHNVVNK